MAGFAWVFVAEKVTGIRQDPYSKYHRGVVEEEKPADERGTYLHPTAWGQPEERGLERRLHPEPMRELRAHPSSIAP